MPTPLFSGSKDERVNHPMHWDFGDGESSITMIRPSKSKEGKPVDGHTPNHYENGTAAAANHLITEAKEEEGHDSSAPMELQLQLGIDDTAFVCSNDVSGQRNSLVSVEDGVGLQSNSSAVSMKENTGMIVVSIGQTLLVV